MNREKCRVGELPALVTQSHEIDGDLCETRRRINSQGNLKHCRLRHQAMPSAECGCPDSSGNGAEFSSGKLFHNDVQISLFFVGPIQACLRARRSKTRCHFEWMAYKKSLVSHPFFMGSIYNCLEVELPGEFNLTWTVDGGGRGVSSAQLAEKGAGLVYADISELWVIEKVSYVHAKQIGRA